jgi:putative transposase
VGATVKAGLLDLVDAAVEQGWTRRRAAALLGLDDDTPGGAPVHGLLPVEREAIVWLHEHWGGVDKSHRKLAHRGSRLDLVHVSESTVWRVLKAENLLLPGRSPREPQIKAPWPEWVAWKPNVIWCYDFTHFTRAKRVAVAVLDIVSRKWLASLVSAEETSTQIEVCFTDALTAEGLDQLLDHLLLARLRAGEVDPDDLDDEAVPVLLAMSDNGPQMRSHTTREFMAACAIMQRFGRPGTPTDQAWVESLFGHVKGDWPHLEKIRDPAQLAVELEGVRVEYNTVRLHAGIGYVTPEDEHDGHGDAIRQRRADGLAQARQKRIDYRQSQQENQP